MGLEERPDLPQEVAIDDPGGESGLKATGEPVELHVLAEDLREECRWRVSVPTHEGEEELFFFAEVGCRFAREERARRGGGGRAGRVKGGASSPRV